MKLNDIFTQLSIGEFSQISIGKQNAGVVNETNWPILIAHINLGLNDLYKRFNLKEGRIKLELQTGQTVYNLTSEYAVSNARSTALVRYINDSVEFPFKDDINKIERVVTDDLVELQLNNGSDLFSLMTPSALTLRVPKIMVSDGLDVPDRLNTEFLDIHYRAKHPQIVIPIGYFDPARVNVELPDSHLNALLLFVASRVHAPIGIVNELNFSNNYFAKYQAECQMLEDRGFEVDDQEQSFRIFRNGWV